MKKPFKAFLNTDRVEGFRGNVRPTPQNGLLMTHWLCIVVSLLLFIASPPARAAGLCSPFIGAATLNEYNHQDDFVEVKTLVTGTSFTNWKVRVYSSSGSFNQRSLPTSGANLCGRYQTTSFNSNETPPDADVVLLDANDDVVDILRGRTGGSITGFYPRPSCNYVGPSTDLTGVLNSNKGIDRQPDGTGAWRNTPGTGAGSFTTRCAGNTPNNATSVNLVMTKTAGAATVALNGTVTFTLTVSNSGPNAATSLQVADTLPAGLQYVSNTAPTAGTFSSSTLLWDIASLANGASASMTMTVRGVTAGAQVNTAVAASDNTETNSANNTATATVTVMDVPTVAKSFSPSTIAVNGTSVLTITLTNPNAAAITGAAFTDTYPANVTNTSAASGATTCSGGTVTAANSGSSVALSGATIAANSSCTVTVNVTSSVVGSYTDSTGPVSTTNAGTGAAASATLVVSNAAVDHYEVTVPSSNVACLASTVTVKACANASNPCTSVATTVNGTATLSTSAGTLGATSLTFASGVASTTLSYPAAPNDAAATLTLSAESIAATGARTCCVGTSCSTANSCAATFKTAGFIFAASTTGASTTLPVQTAGTSSGTYYLRAVQTGTSTEACVSALTPGATTVNLAYECNNPATCSSSNLMSVNGGSATTIQRNNNGSSLSYTSTSMTFDANGSAPLTFNFSDVGQVTLYAQKAASGALLSALTGSSNAFVVKPGGFVVSDIKCSTWSPSTCAPALASPGNNPAASSATGAAFIQAGQNFSATVTATTSGGAATPNYGKESSPEGVLLTPTLVLPSPGTAGALANASVAGGSFSNGAATVTNLAYSEVGIITLTPSVADGDYLGAGPATGTVTSNVGRFIPNHFTTAVVQACITTPASNSFSYSGQPFSVSISAQNKQGAATLNYSSAFARTTALTDANSVGGVLSNSSVSACAFDQGTAQGTPTAASIAACGSAAAASVRPTFTFTSPATVPTAIKLRATDTDSVSSSTGTDGTSLTAVEGTSTIYSGRIRLFNANGSELLPLPITARVENYFASGGVNGWYTSTVDSCSTLSAGNFAFSYPANSSSFTNNINACTTGISGADFSGSPPTYSVRLKAPGTGKNGATDLTLNLGASATGSACTCSNALAATTCTAATATTASRPWLQFNWTGSTANPTARATFGVSKSGPQIHLRELY